VQCTIGTSHWQSERDIYVKMFYRDLPQIYIQLMKLGFSRQFALDAIQQNFKTGDLRPETPIFYGLGFLWVHWFYPRETYRLAWFFLVSFAIAPFRLAAQLFFNRAEWLCQLPAGLSDRRHLIAHGQKLPPLPAIDQQRVEACRRQGACVTSLADLGLESSGSDDCL
jgi:hypothetical protein